MSREALQDETLKSQLAFQRSQMILVHALYKQLLADKPEPLRIMIAESIKAMARAPLPGDYLSGYGPRLRDEVATRAQTTIDRFLDKVLNDAGGAN